MDSSEQNLLYKWVDTHCHLFMKDWEHPHLEEIIQKIQKFLKFTILVGTQPEDSVKNKKFAEKMEGFYYSQGIHPGHIEDYTDLFLDEVKQNFIHQKKHKMVAIGEIGLDYTYEGYNKLNQQHVFQNQLELAQELKIPVIIHARESIEDCLMILKKYPRIEKVVFHCFTGNIIQAKAILDQGYWISFTGIIVFPKLEDLRKVVQIVPIERLMIETDTPFLTPPPFRGKVNQPMYVSFVGEQVAQIKNKDIEEIANQTTKNAYHFFNITPFA